MENSSCDRQKMEQKFRDVQKLRVTYVDKLEMNTKCIADKDKRCLEQLECRRILTGLEITLRKITRELLTFSSRTGEYCSNIDEADEEFDPKKSSFNRNSAGRMIRRDATVFQTGKVECGQFDDD